MGDPDKERRDYSHRVALSTPSACGTPAPLPTPLRYGMLRDAAGCCAISLRHPTGRCAVLRDPIFKNKNGGEKRTGDPDKKRRDYSHKVAPTNLFAGAHTTRAGLVAAWSKLCA
jgi:hypothetical protein